MRAADRAAAAAAADEAAAALGMAAAQVDELQTHMGREISWARDQALSVGAFHGGCSTLYPTSSIF